MEINYQLLLIVAALFLVLLNGFFVNAEFSIVKVRETRVRELARGGSRSALTAQRIIGQMDEYLSATQLGITLASLGLGWIGEPAFSAIFLPLLSSANLLQPGLTHTLAAGTAFVLITFLHIVLGELAPKSLAIQKPERSVLWTAQPLVWFYRFSYPLIWALNGTALYMLRLLGIRAPSESEPAHSQEEIRQLLAHSHKHGLIGRDKKKLLEQVLKFGERTVRQVMVPAVEVKWLDIGVSLRKNLATATKEKHTRYPLCQGSLDRVLGVIHVKDLFWNHQRIGPSFALDSICREVNFVPENKGIEEMLADFRRTRVHLAVVVDEFGSTEGIVTLEDILEELVGEIQDEFDIGNPPEMVSVIGKGKWKVHGRALLTEVEHAFGIELGDNENDTLGGHVMMVLGRTARVGDMLEIGSAYQVRVVGMKGLQITDLAVKKISGE